MFTKLYYFCFLVALTFLAFGKSSWGHVARDGRIHLGLVGFHQENLFSPRTGEPSTSRTGGLGLVVNGDVDRNGGVEVGAFMMNKNFYRRHQTNLLVERVQRLYMTLGYRHWFHPRFSMALASFTSYSIGDYDVVHDSSGGNPGFATSAQDTSDYGVDFSALFEFWQRERDSAYVDLRYSDAMSDRRGESSNHRALLLGYKLRVQ